MKNLKIGVRLGIAFAIVLALLLAVTLTALLGAMNKLGAMQIEAADAVATNILDAYASTRTILMAGAPARARTGAPAQMALAAA